MQKFNITNKKEENGYNGNEIDEYMHFNLSVILSLLHLRGFVFTHPHSYTTSLDMSIAELKRHNYLRF